MKRYKRMLKNDRGSITTIVLVTVLFILIILSTAYAITATIRRSQLKSELTTKEVYESELNDIDKIYKDLIQ